MPRRNRIEGRLRLVVREPGGRTIAVRTAVNTVMRSGAELLAALVSGTLTTPINGMAVGIDPTPPCPPYEAAALVATAPDGTAVLQLAACAIDPSAIQTAVLADELKVRVSLRSAIGPNRAVSPDDKVAAVEIGEAALGVLASDGNSLVKIYNRVVFEPVPKTRDQELALYWEIDFPYGV